ncbi:putative TPR repeat methyltransferase/Flp pilus assembly protein TadD [Microvirga lupini]|uniref:Putative TPR repeat methyltransferase/Flp pilus assembly protein TadD n=1 Tax=Microvirga lupini TaxID=420324 RepID=A0A7W4YW08_9HYPH|nr:tetratricopeptide repeat protein [Microvirga lupini]MBB3018950.1 putative TPR repeat methyltransferase/Flp pilus assembly protein TadD [Microvirga lupini]
MTNIQLPDIGVTMALVANLQASLPDFGRIVDRFGHPAPALRKLGLMHWENGRFDTAARTFEAALSLTPEDPDLWRDLASVYSASDRDEQALTAIRTSLDLDRNSAPSWQALASIADRLDAAETAEEAYRCTIALDPQASAAHLGLGLLLFRKKHYEEALAAVRISVELDPVNGLAHFALGHLAFIVCDFAACARAFDTAARLTLELDQPSRQKRARAITFQAMIEGRVQEALQNYGAIAGEDREDLDIIARDAFSVLSASGHLEAAAEIGRMRLAEKPDDPVRRYLLDAVLGRSVTGAPTDYIETYFDLFAPQFDSKLTETLQYNAPRQMVKLVAGHRTGFSHMLDLGCGTGLAAAELQPLGENLIGVDLSSGMLAEAAKRGPYTELVKAEARAYLEAAQSRFDLIFAADSLIYFGDLKPLMRAAADALVPGGIFALSIELAAGDGFTLQPSGRFAHSLDHLKVAAAYFAILETQESTIRLEAGKPVPGLYIVMQRQ